MKRRVLFYDDSPDRDVLDCPCGGVCGAVDDWLWGCAGHEINVERRANELVLTCAGREMVLERLASAIQGVPE